jgi:hypothetical protein
MMAGFYRRRLIEPTELEHHARGFQGAVEAIKQRIKKSAIRDVIVVIEHTGKFHHPCKRAFVAAGFEVRIVHPFTTKRFRQPAHPDTKGPGAAFSASGRRTSDRPPQGSEGASMGPRFCRPGAVTPVGANQALSTASPAQNSRWPHRMQRNAWIG